MNQIKTDSDDNEVQCLVNNIGLDKWIFSNIHNVPDIELKVSENEKNDSYSLISDTYFMPVSCFLFFNFFDLCGRTTAGFMQYVSVFLKIW